MSFWIVLLFTCLAAAVSGTLYVVFHARKLGIVKKISQKNRLLGVLASLCPIALCLLFSFVNFYGAVVAILHLVLVWILCDIFAFIIRKLRRKERSERYITGYVAMALTAAVLCYGWIMAHHVFETDYQIKTAKPLGQDRLRIVMLADLHLGVTLDGDGFAEQVKRIQDTSPDMVVICGDFVDDDSDRENMVKACKALGTLKTAYGVFWVYGNHDRGYSDYRDFKISDLLTELKRNNVRVLQDSVVELNEYITLIGREDKSHKDRKSAEELMKNADRSKYIIMLDHQPNDYDAEASAGADLVLSGHTHGGHVFPAGPIGMLMGANDKLYGKEVRDNTTFIVTSGISGWAIPFKTAACSEFVVIDITA